MNLATLRVEGPDEAMETLRSLLGLTPEVTYKQGDVMRNGKVHSSSGFGVTIVDAPNQIAMVQGLHAFLAACSQKTPQLPTGLSVEVAIGVTVGDSEQYIACIDFLPSDMLLLGTLGFKLSVAAYPTSDEANAST